MECVIVVRWFISSYLLHIRSNPLVEYMLNGTAIKEALTNGKNTKGRDCDELYPGCPLDRTSINGVLEKFLPQSAKHWECSDLKNFELYVTNYSFIAIMMRFWMVPGFYPQQKDPNSSPSWYIRDEDERVRESSNSNKIENHSKRSLFVHLSLTYKIV